MWEDREGLKAKMHDKLGLFYYYMHEMKVSKYHHHAYIHIYLEFGVWFSVLLGGLISL